MKHLSFISFTGFNYTSNQVLKQSKDLYELMDKRSSLRVFSDKPVEKKVVENIIMTASSAPQEHISNRGFLARLIQMS